MFQLFLRARADFRARSLDRDLKADHQRLLSVVQTLDAAINSAEAEHAGLNARMNEVLGRAAVTIGNDTDEYLWRDPRDSQNQNLLDQQLIAGRKRLDQLTTTITHLKFLRTVFKTRFPHFKESAD
jgi:hypothetical protein